MLGRVPVAGVSPAIGDTGAETSCCAAVEEFEPDDFDGAPDDARGARSCPL